MLQTIKLFLCSFAARHAYTDDALFVCPSAARHIYTHNGVLLLLQVKPMLRDDRMNLQPRGVA